MKKYLYIIISLIIAAYQYAILFDRFTEAELNDIAKRPLYSEGLDLSKPGTIVWNIPANRLDFADEEAKLALALNIYSLFELPKDRNEVQLRVKVSIQGRQPNQEWEDRLVRDWYSDTDEPFSAKGDGLWERSGLGQFEYGLARLKVVPGEKIRITLEVQVPDGLLMTGYPRLKLMPSVDTHRYGPFVRSFYRMVWFLLSCIGLAWLVYRAWQGERPCPGQGKA